MSGYETIAAGDYAAVSVSDTGTGIAAEEIGRIFEPFYSTKRLHDGSGTGLGLAVVHGVVKEHEGYLNVESAAGRGTTFTLYFRRSDAAPPRAQPSIAPRGSARILVVDDEALQLRAARRVLTHLGYEVTTLSRGRAAYELFVEAARAARLPQSPYDLVIMDVVLNEAEDGLQILERIQRLFPGQRALVTSGHAPPERGERAAERGFDWLAKPYTHDGLARAVHAALGAPRLSLVGARRHRTGT
jgi:CheY-like chemotaxis protein